MEQQQTTAGAAPAQLPPHVQRKLAKAGKNRGCSAPLVIAAGLFVLVALAATGHKQGEQAAAGTPAPAENAQNAPKTPAADSGAATIPTAKETRATAAEGGKKAAKEQKAAPAPRTAESLTARELSRYFEQAAGAAVWHVSALGVAAEHAAAVKSNGSAAEYANAVARDFSAAAQAAQDFSAAFMAGISATAEGTGIPVAEVAAAISPGGVAVDRLPRALKEHDAAAAEHSAQWQRELQRLAKLRFYGSAALAGALQALGEQTK